MVFARALEVRPARPGGAPGAVWEAPFAGLVDRGGAVPALTWNQWFLAFARLSREGVLKWTPNEHGRSTIRLSNQALEDMRDQSHAGIVSAVTGAMLNNLHR